MKLRLALLAASCLAAAPALANNCAAPTSRDNQNALSGIVNTYYPVVATTAGYSSSTKTFNVGPARTCAGCGTHVLATGDMVLIIQHMRNQIRPENTSAYGANNGSGRGWLNAAETARFGFYRVVSSTASLAGGSVTISGGNGDGVDFPFGPATNQGIIRSTQLVHVPQYANVTLGGTLTAPPFSNAGVPHSGGVPQYTGGVVVLDVAATLNFNGSTIDVSGKGFRGGGGRRLTGAAAGSSSDYMRSSINTNAHGSKGEGTAGSPKFVYDNALNSLYDLTTDGAFLSGVTDGYPGGSLGRGAPGNAGGGGTDVAPTAGNNQNTGGGGGAGYGDGGQGGQFGITGNPGIGGLGVKTSLLQSAGSQLTTGAIGGPWQYATFGGGGGAGSANDAASGLAASGAAGGGIVIIRAQAVTGSGTINANGASATTGPSGDAAGGGGGGGAIILAANQQVGVAAPSLLLTANGGNGGSTTGASNNSGVGGGGGGGTIARTTNITGATTSVSGGLAGTSAGTSSAATAGEAGLATTFGSIYYVGVGNGGAGEIGTTSRSVSSGAECVPFITKSVSPETAASGAQRTMTINVMNPNNGTYPRAMNLTTLPDNYPTGWKNAANPAVTTSACGGPSTTAPPNGDTFNVVGGAITSGGVCTITVQVVGTGTTPITNTIQQDAVTAVIAPTTADEVATVNETPAPAIMYFPSTVTASKSSAVIYDPVNLTSSPKRIPGAHVDYTIGITNGSGSPLTTDSMVVVDKLPAEVKLFVGDYNGAAAGTATYDFVPGTSNLLCNGCISYSTLANPDKDNETHWTSSLSGFTVDGDSSAASITHIRFKTTGQMANASNIQLKYRTIIK